MVHNISFCCVLFDISFDRLLTFGAGGTVLLGFVGGGVLYEASKLESVGIVSNELSAGFFGCGGGADDDDDVVSLEDMLVPDSES